MIAKICVTGLQGKGKLRFIFWQPELHVGAIFTHDCGCSAKEILIDQSSFVC